MNDTPRSAVACALDKLDLIESLLEHHWQQFEVAVDAAQHHLEAHDALLAERRQLAARATAFLREVAS
jgi:hypothetical protein